MKRTVLLVDDERHVVTVVGKMLEQRDFRVISASSGEEALAILEDITPDLALLDIVLPGIDGATLAAFLTLPVVASWLFLVLGGSIIAFTLYLRLLRDWGPTRAGLYAFVSPIIAVMLGVFVFDEPFGAYETLGSTLMLGAAALAMRRDKE